MKRYTFYGEPGESPDYRPSPDGEWVRYADIPQWTRVEDGLPDDEAVCLICVDALVAVGSWNRCSAWFATDAGPVVATHWMPLPEKPE